MAEIKVFAVSDHGQEGSIPGMVRFSCRQISPSSRPGEGEQIAAWDVRGLAAGGRGRIGTAYSSRRGLPNLLRAARADGGDSAERRRQAIPGHRYQDGEEILEGL